MVGAAGFEPAAPCSQSTRGVKTFKPRSDSWRAVHAMARQWVARGVRTGRHMHTALSTASAGLKWLRSIFPPSRPEAVGSANRQAMESASSREPAESERSRSSRPSPRGPPKLVTWRLPDEHAFRLLEWLYDDQDQDPLAPGEVLARDIVDCYRSMLCELGWDERPWSLVGARFRRLLCSESKKTYRWVKNPDGTRSRLCVYTLPERRPAMREARVRPVSDRPRAGSEPALASAA